MRKRKIQPCTQLSFQFPMQVAHNNSLCKIPATEKAYEFIKQNNFSASKNREVLETEFQSQLDHIYLNFPKIGFSKFLITTELTIGDVILYNFLPIEISPYLSENTEGENSTTLAILKVLEITFENDKKNIELGHLFVGNSLNTSNSNDAYDNRLENYTENQAGKVVLMIDPTSETSINFYSSIFTDDYLSDQRLDWLIKEDEKDNLERRKLIFNDFRN